MKKEEEYFWYGVTFLNFQSGSENEPSEAVIKLITDFTIACHKEHIRVYTNIQMGKPSGCPPGGCT
jgi:hypothetical protein